MSVFRLCENIILPSLVGGMCHVCHAWHRGPRLTRCPGRGRVLDGSVAGLPRVGGFESIKHEMLDDVALAKLFERHRHRVGLRAAPDLLSVRLYKGNRHAFWGMTKNILEGLNGRLWLAPAVDSLARFCILDARSIARSRAWSRAIAGSSRPGVPPM